MNETSKIPLTPDKTPSSPPNQGVHASDPASGPGPAPAAGSPAGTPTPSAVPAASETRRVPPAPGSAETAPAGHEPASEPTSEPSSDTPAPPSAPLVELTEEERGAFPITPEALSEFCAACRHAGLSPAQARAMLEYHMVRYAAYQDADTRERRDTLARWDREMLADRDFGGRRFKQTMADAARALAAFDDDDGALRRLLDSTQMRTNPAVLRVMARIGRALGEDSAQAKGSRARSLPDLAERLFG